MNLVFGIPFLWLAVICFYVAFRKGSATTPAQVFQEIFTAMTGGGPPTASTDPETAGYFLGMAPGQLAASAPTSLAGLLPGASGGNADTAPSGASGGESDDDDSDLEGASGGFLLPGASGGNAG